MGEPSFWNQLWKALRRVLSWLAVKLLAPGLALLVVAGAILLVVLGCKNIQIGGILGKLFGHKEPGTPSLGPANSVPKDRVDSQGRVIPQGQPDSTGVTQAVVVPIEKPGLFDNPTTVKFTPSGETKPVEVKLPDGVRAKDVGSVVVVKPEVYVVTVKDESQIPAAKIDDLLAKYGG